MLCSTWLSEMDMPVVFLDCALSGRYGLTKLVEAALRLQCQVKVTVLYPRRLMLVNTH
jgi:hypothetical protein